MDRSDVNLDTEYMLTTYDNPFDPFTQFDQWRTFDEQADYYTSQLLARIVITSPDLSEADEAQAIQLAINEIVEYNVLGIYRKVTRTESES